MDIAYSLYKLIIIVGLPCSGKTTLAMEINSCNNIKLFDDFISSFCNGKLVQALNDPLQKICINDPRLCDINTFKRYFIAIKNIVNENDIGVILIKPNINECLERNIIRNQIYNNKDVEFDIIKLSKIYNVQNYKNYVNVFIK